jgi:hypothetical protein
MSRSKGLKIAGFIVAGVLLFAVAATLMTLRVKRAIPEQGPPQETGLSPTSAAPNGGDSPRPMPRPTPPPPTSDDHTSREDTVSRFAGIEAPHQAPVGVEFSVQVALTRDKPFEPTHVKALGEGVQTTAEGALRFPCPEPCVANAVLFAPGFDILSGSNEGDIRIYPDRDSPPLRFRLRSRAGLNRVATVISADFWLKGAFLARAERAISIGAAAEAPPTVSETSSLNLDQHRAVADLNVRWEERDVLSQHFCLATVDQPGLPPQPWDDCPASSKIEAFLRNRYNGVLRDFIRGTKPAYAAGAPMLSSQLRGLGRELYEQFAPPTFKQALAQWRSAPDSYVRSIQIGTNNPILPWELMVPCDSCGFLGVDYQVARWHISAHAPDVAPQTMHYQSLVVIAPRYPGSMSLAGQQKEVAALAATPGFHETGGTVADFRQAFESADGTILHFAGHGSSNQGYQIRMEDDQADPTMLRGWHRGAAARLYFLNACESGQENAIGGFVDGWAPALLESGAGAFIGGMWPLGDQTAEQFARQFYTRLSNGLNATSGVQIAELVRQGRGSFDKTGDATYLAYVLYGDVRLRMVR